MSAKHSKKSARKGLPVASPSPAPGVASGPTATAPGSVTPTEAPPAWLDSPNPRKRTLGKVVLAGVWIYVAALWLLALDQTFHWGIFGPNVPPLP